MQLVEIKNKELMTTSLIFAKEFELNHQHVLEKIKNLTVEYSTVKNQFREDVFTNNRNREYHFYWITRDGYMTLVMNMGAKGKSLERLFEKKQMFIKAFNELERRLLIEYTNKKNAEWLSYREQGKNVRIELTDTIKDFVEYAKNQGSTNAERYYGNITKMEYKALGIIQEAKPEIRNTLDTLQLYQLILAEDLAKRMIKAYMDEGKHYKEIYLLVKQDIEKFAESNKIDKSKKEITI